MSSVEPATYEGYGRKGRDDITRGGLVNIAFSSRCPPDVQPNTRIIALCGVNDYTGEDPFDLSSEEDEPSTVSKKKKKATTLFSKSKTLFSPSKRKERKEEKAAQKEKAGKAKAPRAGKASPTLDGWFISDFYMFWHLFRGLGANQLWLTCENPTDLVRKYTSYAQGDPKGDRRVILNSAMLSDMQAAKNIRVFKRAELLQDFIRTFQSECAIAAAQDQPILLLVFGHGDRATHGISIGGAGAPLNAPKLHKRQILACLRGINVSVTMLLTSCFSGGWVLQPELNITALTAAGPQVESWSQAISNSGRGNDSLYATAVRLALIKMEDERATQVHPHPSGEEIDDERLSTTYAELTNVIYSTLVHDVDIISHHPHGIQFAAQNDEWEFEWRKRTGIPIGRFQQRWNSLPVVPPQVTSPAVAVSGGLGMQSLSLSEVS